METTPRLYGREDGWEQLRIFGMGIASYDVTKDGYPEYMLTSMAKSRGVDRDGRLDLVVANRGSPVEMFHNQSDTSGNWLQVSLEQSGPNRNGIGAWIEVSDGARTWTREVTVGGGHASGANGWIHFGLGAAQPASIAVQWPDGYTARFEDVQPNTFVTLAR